MKLLKLHHDSVTKDINIYENESPKLIEKSKIPIKNQEKMKILQ